MTKIGRNDPCPCGSGKKYKKCCESKESAPKKRTAHRIEGEDLTNKTSDISGLFQKITFHQPAKQEETSSKSEEDAPISSEEALEDQKKDDSDPPEKT